MIDINEFKSILRGSKRYEFEEDDRFVITGYYDGRRVALDLTRIDQEMLDELIIEDEDEDEDDYTYSEGRRHY